MWNQKSRWAAVFGCEILVFISERNPRLVVKEIFQGQICCVTAIRMHQGMGRVRFYLCQQSIDGDAFQVSAEFGPSRHTVQINLDGLGGQVAKRFPIPSPQLISAVIDCELPLIERYVRRWSGGQHGEVSSHVLSRRQLCVFRAASTQKTS